MSLNLDGERSISSPTPLLRHYYFVVLFLQSQHFVALLQQAPYFLTMSIIPYGHMSLSGLEGRRLALRLSSLLAGYCD
jgi:hypothetical protein